MQDVKGITLIELLIVITLIGILLALAFPAFGRLVDGVRASTTADRVHSVLNVARHEAVFSRQWVVVCRTRDDQSCVYEGPWSDGTMTFVDRDRNQQRSPDEKLVASNGASDFAGVRLVASATRKTIGFRPDGRSAGTNLTLRLCSGDGELRHLLVVNTGGRTRKSSVPKGTGTCEGS